jgi:hypothetical protein
MWMIKGGVRKGVWLTVADEKSTIDLNRKQKTVELPMEERSFEIFDLMACNVYWDFGNYPGGERQHKYLFAIAAANDEFHPSCVEKIMAYGPNNLEVEIANQFFTQEQADGYIYDASIGNYWYMKNMRNGFMEPGEYHIEITFKNGHVSGISRLQDNAPSDKLVDAYLKSKERIEYHPDAPLADGTDLTDLKVRWSTLKGLSGTDAFYIFRLSKAEVWWAFDIQNLVFWDNVFVERFKDTLYARNKSGIIIPKTLEPDTGYAWWTEICDSNKMGDTNICIFQPVQAFRTPKG